MHKNVRLTAPQAGRLVALIASGKLPLRATVDAELIRLGWVRVADHKARFAIAESWAEEELFNLQDFRKIHAHLAPEEWTKLENKT